ncbi:GNAT family N-acetyltransferase [Paenibacillus antri]|uniref:Bifunctional AAC/APH n=1 Tax=Paenibacillus antri TaxID=2582848 RepID=A0A5R9G356_9BACL|nr:GNAT family N-acetyltransferase [Paenibacillus antri]TLS50787.1 GNAT family N-acetyltransferase [Paenibacillus antri]
MNSTIIRNERVALRRTSGEADLNFVVSAERDEANRPYITPWELERHREAATDDDMLHLIIEGAGGERAGFAILLGTASVRGTIELLRLVVTAKGKGYGKAALQAVQAYAFRERHARRLWLDVKERNARARNLYETMGFRVEGRMRDVCREEEGYESLLIMSILEHEYDPDANAREPAPEEALESLRKRGIVPASSVLSPRMAGKTDGRVYAIASDGLPRFMLKYDVPDYIRTAATFLREHARSGWMPEVRYIDPEYRYFVYDYVPGRPGAEAISVPKAEWMGALMRNVVNRYRLSSATQGWGWLDEMRAPTWAAFLERRIGEARRRIGDMLPMEDHLAALRMVDAKHGADPEPYSLHGDCGAHNFLFGDVGLIGVIDPSPMIGPPLYDALFAFCSTPDDLTPEALEASLRDLDPKFLPDGDSVSLATGMLLALYARISTCAKYGMDPTEYLRAWSWWKQRAGLRP